MLSVSAHALDRLTRKLDLQKAEEDVAMRFTRRPGGWSLRPDRARPDDATFRHKGRDVLLLDRAVSQAMADMSLETRDTDSGPRLQLRRSTKD